MDELQRSNTMSLEMIVLMSVLAIGSTLDAPAQAAAKERIAAAAAPAAPKPKAPPTFAPPPSEHYAAAHAGTTGHPWKF
jgi:hypothetical protein